MSSATHDQATSLNRRRTIETILSHVIAALFGKEPSELDTHRSFLELGADSLFLLQAAAAVHEEFKIKVPFRLLLEDLSTINALSIHLDERLPPDFKPSAQARDVISAVQSSAVENQTFDRAQRVRRPDGQQQPSPADTVKQPTQTAIPEWSDILSTTDGGINAIFERQLMLMSQQLAILNSYQNVPSKKTYESGRRSPTISDRDGQSMPEKKLAVQAESSVSQSRQVEGSSEVEPEVFVPYESIETRSSALTKRQQAHVQGLITRITHRTKTSKKITQEGRPFHADNRAVAGFRMMWKEMVYPLLIDRGRGAHIWDVDGNEYVDMTMGFGALLFGHSPPFIIEALQNQLQRGLQLGPDSKDASEAARLVCEMTGVERVAFCNSGTEAVMTALRLARTVTGRAKIALFEGCYHGTFDGIMVKSSSAPDGRLTAVPMAPGVPEHMIQNVFMLKYNDFESLKVLETHASEMAAVLIEPPRSRRPDVQPRQFLQELRRITQQAGAALIFDEVVTGFRFHPGGAQAMYGIQADLVTYGKAIGGGLPIAAIAGRSKFMDAVDGGMWRYGDDSYPPADITFFAGTYFKHPLIMPGVVAALKYIRQRGTELQESLNAKAQYITEKLSEFFTQQRFPLRIAQLGSLFRILHGPELKYPDLLFFHLLEKGVYVCETHNFLLSTAHSDADVEKVIAAIKESMQELREGEFLPVNSVTQSPASAIQSPGEPPPRDDGGQAGRVLPLTESQRQIWAISHLGEEESQAYNLCSAMELKGKLHVESLRDALQTIVNRHEALRTRFCEDGDFQIISPLHVELPFDDFSSLPENEQRKKMEGLLRMEGRRTFDFAKAPLFRFRLLKLKPDLHMLLQTQHHIISDGWSFGIVFGELLEIYSARVTGREPELRVPRSFSEYVKTRTARESALDGSETESFWLREFPDSLPTLRLPTDFEKQEHSSVAGAQRRVTMPALMTVGMKEIAHKFACTTFMVELAAFSIFLFHLTRQQDIVIGIPTAGQGLPGGGYLVGCCVNLLALRILINPEQKLPEFLLSLKRKLLDVYEHQDFPFSILLKRLRAMHPQQPEPEISAIFNVDRAGSRTGKYELEFRIVPNHNQTSKFDLTVDLAESNEGLTIDFEYRTSLFTPATIVAWMDRFQKLIAEINRDPGKRIADFLALLRQEEILYNTLAAEEFTRQEHARFASSKRKVVEAQGVNS